MQNQTVWIIDDEVELAETFSDILKSTVKVQCFHSAKDVLNALSKGQKPDLFVSDINMPEMNGIELIHELRQRRIQTPVIIITGFADKEYAIQALSLGVFSLLEKPFHQSLFKHSVFRALMFGTYVQMTEDLIDQYTNLHSLMNTLINKCRDRYVEAENKLEETAQSKADRNKILKYMKDIVAESHLETDIDRSYGIIQGVIEKRNLLKALVSEPLKNNKSISPD